MVFLGCSFESRTGDEPSLPARIGSQSRLKRATSRFEPHQKVRTNRGNIVSVPHAWANKSITCFRFLLTSPRNSSPWSRRKPNRLELVNQISDEGVVSVDSIRSPRGLNNESGGHLQPHFSPSRHRQGRARHLFLCLTFAHSRRGQPVSRRVHRRANHRPPFRPARRRDRRACPCPGVTTCMLLWLPESGCSRFGLVGPDQNICGDNAYSVRRYGHLRYFRC